jgi:phosphatidylethanolamine-binding protein (PEBP) family uncharacterized protein
MPVTGIRWRARRRAAIRWRAGRPPPIRWQAGVPPTIRWRLGGPVLRLVAPVFAAGLALGALAGCGGGSAPAPGTTSAATGAPSLPATGATASISVRSPAFGAGQPIPAEYTCDGAGEPPPLSWSGVPGSAGSVALVVDDPDAPGGTYTHWVLAGLPATDGSVRGGTVPSGAVQALSSAASAVWTPPSQPGATHHSRYTEYALSGPAPFADGVGTQEALGAIRSAAVASGTLVGVYSRT